ncbi:transposon Tf2-8 polyprotein [Trichonephila clavipes]|uniref:Transposon Tf2-8 polyprotein n=1 Tax=Trichonephila clavipes TaxID=2585209 RepID=A0A8X6V942_TRICX|nr:transposon Tf2-8 polyprotein [Trichonephila clavipes]
MDLFLTLFERQMKLLDLGEDLWVPYLIGALPNDATSLIAREPEEKCRDYSHIRGMLLQRFKLTAEKFRELFSRQRKSPNGTWKDYFEIRAYFEGWLNELKINSFDGLKNLIIAGQMKKRCSSECKEYYLDIWEELISPEMSADKLEAFDNIRRSLPSEPRRYVKASEIVNDGRQVSFRKPERPPKREYSHHVPNERSPLRCYGCGKQGVMKSRYHTCNLNASQRTDVATNHINAYTAQTRSPRLALIDITFCRIKGRETTLTMSLADVQQTTGEVLTTQVRVEIEARSGLTIILPKAKGNRTLLGTDFLSSAGLVLDVKNTCWYFWDNPTHRYPFGEELDTPSIVEKMSSNTCQLREGEGESLTSAQKEKLNLLLESFQNVFEPGGEATNILDHHINSGKSPPISVPPYRMSPVKDCPDCIKYKASNQKPSGGKRWIIINENCTTKWVELFALPNATAKECAITLIEEVLLRYDIPRRLISDNGTQFVSAVMQQICYLLNTHQSLIPVYHPQANPVERKNRDLKPRLAILVQDKHDCWSKKLPFIRFALDTAKCEMTGQTAAFLNFGRELRIPSEVVNDFRVVIQNDNFVPEITPYLSRNSLSFPLRLERRLKSNRIVGSLTQIIREKLLQHINLENVFVASHPLSNAAQGRSVKLMPRRDGPYVILTQRSPSSYEIASLDNPGEPLGVCHTSALIPCNNDKIKPLNPLRKRGRPPKVPQSPGSSSGRRRNQRGRM